MKEYKPRQITLLALVFILGIAEIFGVANYEYSTDVEQLFFKHNSECRTGDIYWDFHTFSEPGLYFANIIIPCAINISAYTYGLALVILLLKLVVSSKFASVFEAIFYFMMASFFLDTYTQTHLFRQVLSSFLMLIWLIDRRTGWYVIPISFLFHNATTLILYMLFDAKKIVAYIWSNKFHLIFPVILLMSYGLLEFADAPVFEYLFYRYGFAFTDDPIPILSSFAGSLLKYFLFGFLIGLCDAIWNKENTLLNLCIFGVLFFGLSIVFDLNAEFVFRVLVPLKFVILPYLISRSIFRFIKRVKNNTAELRGNNHIT